MHADLADMKVSAKAIAAWLPAGRSLHAIAGTPLVELKLPEYEAAGLGKALCRTRAFHCIESGAKGAFARSICADSSRMLVVTSDMEPTVLGQTHDEIQTSASQEVVRRLFDLYMPIELVTLGASRASQFSMLENLIDFVRLYHRRASWLEANPLDVAIANLESHAGAPLVFDGARLFCEGT
jgi:hypothetical protein